MRPRLRHAGRERTHVTTSTPSCLAGSRKGPNQIQGDAADDAVMIRFVQDHVIRLSPREQSANNWPRTPGNSSVSAGLNHRKTNENPRLSRPSHPFDEFRNLERDHHGVPDRWQQIVVVAAADCPWRGPLTVGDLVKEARYPGTTGLRIHTGQTCTNTMKSLQFYEGFPRIDL